MTTTATHQTATLQDSETIDPVVAAARLLLEQLGIPVADLLAAHTGRTPMPTIAEYLPAVRAASTTASTKTREPHWQLLAQEWGNRRINEPTLSELEALANQVQERSQTRPNSRGGHGAKSNFVDTAKHFYRHAVLDRKIPAFANPAAHLKNHRIANARRALADRELAEINETAATTGRDPALDTLILRLHTETACRISGAVALRSNDLDRTNCLARLREKGRTRYQPVSPTLMAALIAHTEQRSPHNHPHEQLLRHHDGRPITSTHYTTLWTRIGRQLPWVSTLGVTTHWIRYTTLTWVERHFGYATAAAFAGHAKNNAWTGNTMTYVGATLEEVAATLAALTGEPHPRAPAKAVTCLPTGGTPAFD
ncbi:tyrosine-type recombinase/integrase [Amycolatopsis samaneae]|uniref:Tyrosine-type recombinase/integrase n=1 Tax=Amycolatopsis samaneae TaxID=664691 RepID=A0ABW5GX16_9PSEU